MRRSYRDKPVNDYWDARWESAGPDAQCFSDTSIYPIKYALDQLEDGAEVLEVGFGSGRILFHLLGIGARVTGIDNSHAAAEVVRRVHTVPIVVGSVTNLPFQSGRFDLVLAFGVIHGIESEPERALIEISRVLKDRGRFVVSLRADNLETRINDLRWKVKSGRPSGTRHFHKWLFRYSDLPDFFSVAELKVQRIEFARNVPNLFRFRHLRRKGLVNATETTMRSEGFALNSLGRLLDHLTYGLMPKLFCSIYCVSGSKMVRN